MAKMQTDVPQCLCVRATSAESHAKAPTKQFPQAEGSCDAAFWISLDRYGPQVWIACGFWGLVRAAKYDSQANGCFLKHRCQQNVLHRGLYVSRYVSEVWFGVCFALTCLLSTPIPLLCRRSSSHSLRDMWLEEYNSSGLIRHCECGRSTSMPLKFHADQF